MGITRFFTTFVTITLTFMSVTADARSRSAKYKYVDLGLTSGTLWATYNIGATKPEEYGDYFAWGETKPKEDYSWSTYKWCENKKVDDEWGIPNDFTKYCTSSKYGTVDNKTVLDAEDDAATANWGSEWRMPTNEEQRELVEECQYQMTEVNGVYGAKFTGKNGNSVFFPAAGGRYGSDANGVGGYGDYWSSSLFEKDEEDRLYARSLDFVNDEAYLFIYLRYDGFPVRAVLAK